MGIYYGRSNIELYLTKVTMSFTWLAAALLAAVTMSFTWLAAALLAAQRLSYTLEYPRISLSLSLPPSRKNAIYFAKETVSSTPCICDDNKQILGPDFQANWSLH